MSNPALSPLPTIFRLAAFVLACTLATVACTPRYDWRDVQGKGVPFTVLMPSKPATHTRQVNIGGTEVPMTMTATEVDGVMFAVGSAELPEATQAVAALAAMKVALVRNIGGVIKTEKTTVSTAPPRTTMHVEAVGAAGPDSDGHSRVLFVDLVAQDKRVYQALVLGPEPAVSQEVVETFLSSFKTE